MRRRRNLKRSGQIVGIGLLIFIGICLAPLVGVVAECRVFGGVDPAKMAPEAEPAETAGLSGYARSEDQTYLTLPEWYIVYSADEYAAFVEDNPPSRFPYFQAIGQYWQSYYDICAVTRDHYPFNSGYHLVNVVIGVSFTAENILKGAYEVTVGRISEWVSSSALTEEDAYARRVAKEYGGFIHTIPWYEFPFAEKLNGLWGETSRWGPNVIRKWERKFALSLEYGVKAIYGWLIRKASQSTYAPEDLEIRAWVEGLSDEVLKQAPQIRIIKTINAQASIAAIPRYEAFTQTVPRLAQQGVRFVEIAGNDEILITAIAPQDWDYDLSAGEFLFAMPILTQPDLKRVAVKVPVASLHLVLKELARRDITLEHVYDY